MRIITYGLQPSEKIILTVARLDAGEVSGRGRFLRVRAAIGSVRYIVVGTGGLGAAGVWPTACGFVPDESTAMADDFGDAEFAEAMGSSSLRLMACGVQLAGNRDGSDALADGTRDRRQRRLDCAQGDSRGPGLCSHHLRCVGRVWSALALGPFAERYETRSRVLLANAPLNISVLHCVASPGPQPRWTLEALADALGRAGHHSVVLYQSSPNEEAVPSSATVIESRCLANPCFSGCVRAAVPRETRTVRFRQWPDAVHSH